MIEALWTLVLVSIEKEFILCMFENNVLILYQNIDISKDKWAKMTAANGWNAVEIRDNRYNHIVHMVSAANGAEDFYSTEVILLNRRANNSKMYGIFYCIRSMLAVLKVLNWQEIWIINQLRLGLAILISM